MWVSKAMTYIARLVTRLAQIAILLGKAEVGSGPIGDCWLQMRGCSGGSRVLIAGEHQEHSSGTEEIAGSLGRVVCFGSFGIFCDADAEFRFAEGIFAQEVLTASIASEIAPLLVAEVSQKFYEHMMEQFFNLHRTPGCHRKAHRLAWR
jgi:hypothetical protein